MENVKEEPKENSRVLNLRPKRQRKTRRSTPSSSQRESALQGKSGHSGKRDAEGEEKKNSEPIAFEDLHASSSESETETKVRGGRPLRSNNAMSLESTWSDTDKQRLLIALQRFGVSEIDELIKAVPGKSEDNIRKFITYKWKMARMELRNKYKEIRKAFPDKSPYLGPVDKWLDVLNSYYPGYDYYKTNPIARTALLLWKNEEQPTPSECGGIDFKALYEHLYYLLAGYPPKHLNQPTALYFQETMSSFSNNFNSKNWTEEWKLLKGSLYINTQTWPPSAEKEVFSAMSHTKEQCFDELLKAPGFNPFSIPKEWLQKKVPEDIRGTITASDRKNNQAKKTTISKKN